MGCLTVHESGALSMIFLALIIIGTAALLAAVLLGRRCIRYFGVTLLAALALQYGPLLFLDERGRAELFMWQVISFPIILGGSLLFTGGIGGIMSLRKRLIDRGVEKPNFR